MKFIYCFNGSFAANLPLIAVLVLPTATSGKPQIEKNSAQNEKKREARVEPFSEDEEFGEIFGETGVLVAGLTNRNMPELVEHLLQAHPPACRIYIARAYLHAATASKNGAQRDRFMDRAAEEYKQLIGREQSSKWMEDDRRRVLATQARLEWAGLLLRYRSADDLDQFELTSGLRFERERLKSWLRQSVELYEQARVMIDVMQIGLRTQEEHYLLLGLTDKIEQLAARYRHESAWADVYLAMISEVETPDRSALLSRALTKFDKTAETSRDAALKHHALIGAGITLRENGQWREAQSAFDRVIDSTASIGVIARARYELGRALIQGRQYDEARKELDSLGRIAPERLKGEDAGGKFYLRLAPLVHAFASIREYQQALGAQSAKNALRDRAMQELDAVARTNPAWQSIVRVYLEQISEAGQDFAKMSDTQIAMHVHDLMGKDEFAKAIPPLRILVDRKADPKTHDEARYNLAVCYFQTGQLRPAGDLFLSAAESKSLDVARRSAEFALRVWSRYAADSKAPNDYRKLAQVADVLVREYPDHPDAEDARWMAALARQEAGELGEAIAAYRKIAPGSVHELDARRNTAVCLQKLLEKMPDGMDRAATLRRAAEAWLQAAEAYEKKRSDSKVPREARLAAANILVASELKDYSAAMKAIESLGDDPAAMNLRFRCLRGLGRIDEARQVLRSFLAGSKDRSGDPLLLQWTRQIQQEIDQFKSSGRNEQVRQTAEDGVLMLEQLLEWLPGQTQHTDLLPAVRIALIETMCDAGRADDAAARAEKFLADDPGNGSLLYLAASLAQEKAEVQNKEASEKAERLWTKLLQDQTLREQRPQIYWEARYFWLRHQLRHGQAREVVKGINAEKAWYPDLGGPPWQARLLELAEEASDASQNPSP